MSVQENSDDDRSLIQKEAIRTWLQTRKGTIVLPTGFGKTFVGSTIVAKQLQKGRIESALIVVPTVNLLSQWQKEFEKWEYDYSKVEFLCIKSAYKLIKHYDIVVIDEIHTSLSPEYSKIFSNLGYTQLLGLTATIPKDPSILESFCPVVYTKTIQDALDAKAISEFKMINLGIKLDRNDSGRYRIFDNQFKAAQMQIGVLKREHPELAQKDIFEIAKMYYNQTTGAPLVKASKKFWSAMTLRKYCCYNADSKIPIVLKILNAYPNKKWILFNKSIAFAEKLHSKIPNSLIYHSKLKPEERELILEDFSRSRKVLIAVDALNAGLNVPDADAAITISGVSTELVGIQQLGQLRPISI